MLSRRMNQPLPGILTIQMLDQGYVPPLWQCNVPGISQVEKEVILGG